jgi:hypothetical protein
MLLGWNTETGRPYHLSLKDFRRGATVRGAIGSGKTTLLHKFLTTFGIRHNVVQFDYSGTGAFHFQAFLAHVTSLLAVAGRRVPMLRQIARALVLRHAFATLDDGESDMPIRVDLLRRRTLANGLIESVAPVVDRTFLVLEVKLNTSEPQIRVLFRRVARAVLTCLVAANRPISEGIELLDSRVFASFVFREIERANLRPFDEAYVRPQVQELRRILALWDPDKPSTRKRFDDETGSTRNALMDFAPGTVLGRFFGSEETFNPEDVAFGRQSLSLTTTITDPVLRAQGFQGMHGVLYALLSSRRRAAGPYVPVSIVTDEIMWLGQRAPEFMALARNFDVSYLLAFQNLAQWKAMGLDTMPDQLRSLANLSISMRPDTMEEAKDEVLRTRWVRSGDLVQRFLSRSQSRGESLGSTLTDSWSNTFSRGRSRSLGTGESESESETLGSGWFQGGGSGSNEGETDGGGAGTSHSERLMLQASGDPEVGISDGQSENVSWNRNRGSSAFQNAGTNGSEARGRGRARSRTETDGESTGEARMDGGSRAHMESRQMSETLSEVLHIVSFDEQLSMLAQNALRRARHDAHVLNDGEGAVVTLARAIEYPADLFGIRVVDQFCAVQSRVFESRAVPRTPFNPQPLLTGCVAPARAPRTELDADAEPALTPGLAAAAPTVPKRPIARGRGDRNKR